VESKLEEKKGTQESSCKEGIRALIFARKCGIRIFGCFRGLDTLWVNL